MLWDTRRSYTPITFRRYYNLVLYSSGWTRLVHHSARMPRDTGLARVGLYQYMPLLNLCNLQLIRIEGATGPSQVVRPTVRGVLVFSASWLPLTR